MRSFVLFLALIVHSLANAAEFQPPSNHLFWVSFRHPAEVFASGISARGQNDNLQQYALGISCSTTAPARTQFNEGFENFEQARIISTSLSQRTPGVNVYVYSIRGTPNWHRLDVSLRATYPDRVAMTQQLADMYEQDALWIHPGDVPGPTIRHALQIRNGIAQGVITNNYADPGMPILNRFRPYTPQNNSYNEHLRLQFAQSTFDYMGACQADSVCRNTQPRLFTPASGSAPDVCQTMKFSSLPVKNYLALLWLPILLGLDS